MIASAKLISNFSNSNQLKHFKPLRSHMNIFVSEYSNSGCFEGLNLVGIESMGYSPRFMGNWGFLFTLANFPIFCLLPI
jgi:hypothetical protein